jgi:hypothetical protein
MATKQECPECGMEFDWEGVEVDGEVYCCEACAEGEDCTCPEHAHTQTSVATAFE